jgi:hypothetical protein
MFFFVSKKNTAAVGDHVAVAHSCAGSNHNSKAVALTTSTTYGNGANSGRTTTWIAWVRAAYAGKVPALSGRTRHVRNLCTPFQEVRTRSYVVEIHRGCCREPEMTRDEPICLRTTTQVMATRPRAYTS